MLTILFGSSINLQSRLGGNAREVVSLGSAQETSKKFSHPGGEEKAPHPVGEHHSLRHLLVPCTRDPHTLSRWHRFYNLLVLCSCNKAPINKRNMKPIAQAAVIALLHFVTTARWKTLDWTCVRYNVSRLIFLLTLCPLWRSDTVATALEARFVATFPLKKAAVTTIASIAFGFVLHMYQVYFVDTALSDDRKVLCCIMFHIVTS